jgi:hypothetical protein
MKNLLKSREISGASSVPTRVCWFSDDGCHDFLIGGVSHADPNSWIGLKKGVFER